jgi:hypothetical protein
MGLHDESADTFTAYRVNTEVEEEAYGLSRKSEVAKDLGLMFGPKSLGNLQLNHQNLIHDQIHPEGERNRQPPIG